MVKNHSSDAFKIFVEQLRLRDVEKINEELSPDFLDIHEKELAFSDPIYLTGEAYLAENDLILHFAVTTLVELPCSICNEPVKVPIKVQNMYHHEPLSAIKSGVFNMSEVLREAILLEIPPFAECSGNCPKRKEVEKYLHKPQKDNKEPGYRPFENL